MGLFEKKVSSSVVLVDIDSTSVGGALAHYATKEVPTIYYTARCTIEGKPHESSEDAMLRTLDAIVSDLVSKGSPTLRQAVGSGHVDRIVVTIGSPWQKTSIRMETIMQPKPFTFTRALMAEMLQKDLEIPEGYSKSGETTIATILNGYTIQHPYGKRVNRAQMLILSSLLDTKVCGSIESVLRKAYHTHSLTLTAFAPTAYMVFRDIFPHENDYLTLHVSGKSTDMAVVKHQLLEDSSEVTHGLDDLIEPTETPEEASARKLLNRKEKEWQYSIQNAFELLGKRHSLPRTIFLLSAADSREYIKGMLDAPALRNLWLTDEPLRVIPIIPSHFTPFLLTKGEVEGDVYLFLLALYAAKQISV